MTPKDTYNRGIQLEGTAGVVTNPVEFARAMTAYAGRIFTPDKIKFFIEHRDRPHKFYKIDVAQYVLFDTQNFPDDSRQEFIP